MDHLHVNLFHQPLTSPDDLGVLLHDLLCRDPLLLAVIEKLGDQVPGRPGDGVEKLRVELVVGGGEPCLSEPFKYPQSSQNKSVALFISPFLFFICLRLNHNKAEKGVHAVATLCNRVVIFMSRLEASRL